MIGFAACFFLGLAWLIPNHYPPWITFHGEVVVFLALIFIALPTANVWRTQSFPRLVWWVLAFAVVLLWQWICGQIQHRGTAIVGLLFVMGFAIAVLAGAQKAEIGRFEAAMTALAWVTVAAASVSLYIALLQAIDSEELLGIFAANLPPGWRPFGNLAQSNHLGTLMVMGVLGAARLHHQKLIGRVALISLVCFLSLGIAVSESRTAYLSVFFVGVLLMLRGKEMPSFTQRMVLGWWAALCVITAFWRQLNPGVARELNTLIEDSPRLTLWRQAIAAIDQAPWLGYGFRQAFEAQKVGAATVPSSLPTDYFHNIALDFVVWFGIPIGGLFFAVAVYYLVKVIVRQRTETELFGVAWMTPIGIHCLLEFPYAYAYFLFPLGFVFGGILSTTERQVLKPIRTPIYWQIGLFITFVSCAALVVKDYLVVEDEYRTMRFELRRIGPPAVSNGATNLLILDQFEDLLWASRFTPKSGMTLAELRRFERASFNTIWASLQMRYAVALSLNGYEKQAQLQLTNIRNVYGQKAYDQAIELFMQNIAH